MRKLAAAAERERWRADDDFSRMPEANKFRGPASHGARRKNKRNARCFFTDMTPIYVQWNIILNQFSTTYFLDSKYSRRCKFAEKKKKKTTNSGISRKFFAILFRFVLLFICPVFRDEIVGEEIEVSRR